MKKLSCLLLIISIVFYGCDGMYQKEKTHDEKYLEWLEETVVWSRNVDSAFAVEHNIRDSSGNLIIMEDKPSERMLNEIEKVKNRIKNSR